MITVNITTALDQADIEAVASGEERLTAQQWRKWEEWWLSGYDWARIWDMVQTSWQLAGSNSPLGSVDLDPADVDQYIFNVKGGYLYPHGDDVQASSVVTAPRGDPKVAFQKSPALLDHHVFHNALPGRDKVTQEAEVSLEVKQATSSEWSKTSTIGGSVSVGVKVGVEGAGDVETSTTFSWETSVGETHSVSKELGAGDTSKLSVELASGDWALGLFGAYLGTIVANVPVVATLTGGVVFNVANHHWLNLPDHSTNKLKACRSLFVSWQEIWAVLAGADGDSWPTAEADLTLNVGWYADSRVEVVPMKGGTQQDINDALNDALNDRTVGDQSRMGLNLLEAPVDTVLRAIESSWRES